MKGRHFQIDGEAQEIRPLTKRVHAYRGMAKNGNVRRRALLVSRIGKLTKTSGEPGS